MPLDFTNTNLLWTSVLVETLHRVGLTTAVICPGSRSAPLTIALACHPKIETIPVLDERSAAFFALGLARQQKRPVALVCTSGTAGANFYPAVIEARESRVPLLILTGDRPPELRECNAGQAIDQQKLYGTYPNAYYELALPTADFSHLRYLRQTVVQAWEQTMYPVPGVVHLNCPFREPLAPLPDGTAFSLDEATFFAHLSPRFPAFDVVPGSLPISQWLATPTGVIVAGVAQPTDPEGYCRAIAHLSQTLGYPVLAEGLSPVRNYASLNPNLVATYDLVLRQPELAKALAPEVVIRIGDTPTSKQLRTWLDATQPQQWVVEPSDRNLDPLHLPTTHLRTTVERLAASLPAETAPMTPYLKRWLTAETTTRQSIYQTMTALDALVESKVAWLLSQVLPPETPLFISSSTPVRDVEWFWQPGDRQIQPCFNRGANGIDGSLSTALGMAHRQRPSVMLTGDLALLHDTNGFLLRSHWQGHLTIVLINNNGGGIFEMLPISKFESAFEKYFATPQRVDMAQLCAAYGVEHLEIQSWAELQAKLQVLPERGIRLLEIKTNRKADAQWRHNNLGTFAVAAH
ncbi:MAG TPA: 2-succinyl-5-enolpyruvyl-6-hydroxy-3-cyclohexene-1-carboxylic-acid synthase [Leptolyngbyaceae cyanobacterium M33_DOE_097]|uniref:2-succinyl-5-enolpyruvyl-6-hydroxy-3-cyclohexene-1-carboxylate synthase n=1 Tax=Oscillatoriales cyanobacterium SpSt-418 TaxID=2282169 RepID=A0A7C3KEK2_9CYAN|nr:2-succinyl-5-enolpyruvyl-6-hydroxy-3-cyclohexene-1-carboxylic-acid synthase [Leptolyngbyaceae cyanobacterium M33_DOE_097]